MFGGSVRDRIKAAEAAEGGGKGGQPNSPRRGHKLNLKTDEHIKEEVLRRGDGGWSKNVDIGQHEKFTPGPSVPFIKVTLETPIVESKDPKLPGKLDKSVPGAFESIFEENEGESSSAKAGGSTADREKPEDKSVPEIIVDGPSTNDSAVPTIDPDKRECAPEYAEDSMKKRSKSGSRRTSSKSRHARVEDYDESHDHDGVAFHNVAWKEARSPSRASSTNKRRPHQASTRGERFVVEDAVIDDEEEEDAAPRSRSRASRSKSASRDKSANHERGDDATSSTPRIRKSHSRSGSTHGHGSETHHSPPTSARRSSNSLWPSFSQSERRSMGDVLETMSNRSKSPRPRPRSFHSTSSVRSEMSSKTLEFAEYFAGQKAEHLPQAPPSPTPKHRPLGYVRSKSSAGEYTEHYTRDKHLLKKPDEDEFLEPGHDHKNGRERHHSWHEVAERRKSSDTPWQVRLLQEIAKH